MHRGHPDKALEIVRNFNNSNNDNGKQQYLSGKVMDECHIQLWEEQCNVEALQLIGNDTYVIDQVMQLTGLSFQQRALTRQVDGRRGIVNLNKLDIEKLLQVFKEGLQFQLHPLYHYTFTILVNHYATTNDDVSLSSAVYTKRFLYEFQHLSLFDIASCAASKGDIYALTVLITRHPISIRDRMALLDCIPYEVDIVTYEHLLPCFHVVKATDEERSSVQFLPRSGNDARFMNIQQLFNYLSSNVQQLQMQSDNSGKVGDEVGIFVDDADKNHAMLNLEQDDGFVDTTTISKDEVASWYLKRAMDTHTATGQIVLMGQLDYVMTAAEIGEEKKR